MTGRIYARDVRVGARFWAKDGPHERRRLTVSRIDRVERRCAIGAYEVLRFTYSEGGRLDWAPDDLIGGYVL